jgi:hypothetical protein
VRAGFWPQAQFLRDRILETILGPPVEMLLGTKSPPSVGDGWFVVFDGAFSSGPDSEWADVLMFYVMAIVVLSPCIL